MLFTINVTLVTMLYIIMRKDLNMNDKAYKIVNAIRELIEALSALDAGDALDEYYSGHIDGLKAALDQALMIADGVK